MVCFVFMLAPITGCFYKGYSGEYPELFTVAINSLLWNKGHSDLTDKYCDSEIKVLEKDEYGRTLYMYYEDYYVGDTISFSALIISQYSLDGYVYYYEDCNYLIKEQEMRSKELREFSQEEIANLKKANDWGKELVLTKCTKKQIVRKKQRIPNNEKAIRRKVIERYNAKDGNTFVDYLTNDVNGYFIFYGLVRYIDKSENDYYVAIANAQGDIIDWLVPNNLYNYQEELKSFKQKNGWVSET